MAVFLDRAPPADTLAGVRGQRDEEIRLGRREIYIHYGQGMGTSKLVIPAAKAGTARNMNTVATLGQNGRGGLTIPIVMAGLVPAIHIFLAERKQDVDARDKPGHDDLLGGRESSSGEFQQMRVVTDEERAQQFRIISPDRGRDARPLRKLRPPFPHASAFSRRQRDR